MNRDAIVPTFRLGLSVTLSIVLNSEDVEQAGHPRRSWNPVKWLTSRDRTPLNNLGLALMAIGAATAVAVWIAMFTSKSVPWWPVILGLVVVALGLVLTLATIGPGPTAVSDTAKDDSSPVAPEPAKPSDTEAEIRKAHKANESLAKLFDGTATAPPSGLGSEEATDASSS